MNSIGGYNQLEIRKGEEYHCKGNVLRLNTGRNALELILRIRKYSKIYIPYYSCDAILEPIIKLGLTYEFYSINKYLEPLFDYNCINTNECFLYINYFGIKDGFVRCIAIKCKNIIIDNSQAFFTYPLKNVDTFYSCRKFFGVPDGAYLYLDNALIPEFPQDVSIYRCMHLLQRIEFTAEAGFEDYKKNETLLMGQPIKVMSKLTTALLKGIDYKSIINIRREHFMILHNSLYKYNKIKMRNNQELSPLIYPFLFDMAELRDKLIKHKIYMAHYWPNIEQTLSKDNFVEETYCNQLCALPISQGLCHSDLDYIVKHILFEIKGNDS